MTPDAPARAASRTAQVQPCDLHEADFAGRVAFMHATSSRASDQVATLGPQVWELWQARRESDERVELLEGRVVRKALPTAVHGRVQAGVAGALSGPYDRSPGGDDAPGGWWLCVEVDILLKEAIVRPDIVGWRRDRLPGLPEAGELGLVTERPEWVCEVLSPSTAYRDTGIKRELYHQHQVGHFWMVDPERRWLGAHRWTEAGYVECLVAHADQRVRAAPFEAVTLDLGALLGG